MICKNVINLKNNSYGWAMSEKFPVNNFGWIENTSQLNKYFIKTYNEESDEGYFLKVDVEYLKKLKELHNDLPFLPERMNIEKVEKLVVTLHDKYIICYKYIIQIRNLKQALNHGPVLKKVQDD